MSARGEDIEVGDVVDVVLVLKGVSNRSGTLPKVRFVKAGPVGATFVKDSEKVVRFVPWVNLVEMRKRL